MNKGIVMEVNDIYAIVMNDSGVMEKISCKPGLAVGQKIFYFEEDIIRNSNIKNNSDNNCKDESETKDNVITLDDKRRKISRNNKFIKTFGSIAALFLVVFTFFMHNFTQEKAYAVVTLDINPSIQMEVDSNKKIIKVEGINDDGKKLELSEIKGLNIDEGISIIKQKLIDNNYLDTNHEVLVAFAVVNEKQQNNISYEEEILDSIKTTFKSENIAYVKGNKEAVKEAKSQGISLGRYEAAISSDNQSLKENIKDVPVKEITTIIKNKENCVYIEAEEDKSKVDSSVKDEKTPEDKNVSKPEIKKPENTDTKPNANNTPVKEEKNNTENGDTSSTNNKLDNVIDDKNNEPSENTDVIQEGEILEVPPEIQTPNHQVEVPEGEKPKEEVILDPEEDKIENSKPSSKEEEEIEEDNKIEITPEVITN